MRHFSATLGIIMDAENFVLESSYFICSNIDLSGNN